MSNTYCIFAAQYLPHLGGVERYTYNLSRKLIEKGDKVVVVTSNVQGLAEFEIMDGIPVYRLPCLNLLDGRYPVLKFNKEFRELNSQLNEYSFDFVIVNTRFYIHSLYGVYFAKTHKIKSIVIEHGTSHLTIHNKMWDTIGKIYEHALTRMVRLFCNDYYGVSLACNQWLSHFNIKAKGTMHNAIDLDHIQSVLKHPTISYREKLNIPKDAIIISFTGRLLKEKGLIALINSVNRLNELNMPVYLFIAGDGDLQEYVNQKENKYIRPLGRLTFEEIISMLNETNVFCLPSDSEGFSTSVLEAAACKNYIITTRRGGATELLLDESYGKIIDENDEESVYQALYYLLNHLELIEPAVEKSYTRLIDNFTWEIISDKVINLVKEVYK